jgi:hypothetical protein
MLFVVWRNFCSRHPSRPAHGASQPTLSHKRVYARLRRAMAKCGGSLATWHDLSAVVPAKAGTHTPQRSALARLMRTSILWWLWVPAFAGTTAERFARFYSP